jgi:hypothetical protein
MEAAGDTQPFYFVSVYGCGAVLLPSRTPGLSESNHFGHWRAGDADNQSETQAVLMFSQNECSLNGERVSIIEERYVQLSCSGFPKGVMHLWPSTDHPDT